MEQVKDMSQVEESFHKPFEDALQRQIVEYHIDTRGKLIWQIKDEIRREKATAYIDARRNTVPWRTDYDHVFHKWFDQQHISAVEGVDYKRGDFETQFTPHMGVRYVQKKDKPTQRPAPIDPILAAYYPSPYFSEYETKKREKRNRSWWRRVYWRLLKFLRTL